MTSYGNEWITYLGDDFYKIIENRIKQEKINGQYSKKSSDLSYLTLYELIQLIFERQWQSSFKYVFNSDVGIKNQLKNSILPLRNKIAHFRQIDSFDLNNGIRYASEIEWYAQKYYGSPERVSFYLNSDDENIDELIDFDIQKDIQKELTKLNILYFWDEFAKFESIRSNKIGCGFGVYDKNLFIELKLNSNINLIDFNEWFDDYKYYINSIIIVDPKIRIFFPIRINQNLVKKILNSLYKKVLLDLKKTEQTEFCEGEYIINNRMERPIGLAF
jgi:hypothetical protein